VNTTLSKMREGIAVSSHAKTEREMPKALTTPDHDSVICEVEIAAPADVVFRALTQADLLKQWWDGSDGPCRVKLWEFEPRLGGRHRHVAYDPAGKMQINGLSEFEVHGEVVEFDPPRTLAYTWFANFHSLAGHATLVRWELTPTAGGTVVRMTHSQLKPLTEGASYAQGWPGVIEHLKRFAEAGEE
jgi:uncharacterized protein YndB with AHSA1/START domain